MPFGFLENIFAYGNPHLFEKLWVSPQPSHHATAKKNLKEQSPAPGVPMSVVIFSLCRLIFRCKQSFYIGSAMDKGQHATGKQLEITFKFTLMDNTFFDLSDIPLPIHPRIGRKKIHESIQQQQPGIT